MSRVLDERAQSGSTTGSRLRGTMAAVRLSFVWFGVRKSLTVEQKSQAAETFGAGSQFLSAGKKLLDTRHPAFKAVTSVRNRLVCLWRAMSLPFPDPGIRLIRQDDVEPFTAQAITLKAELDQAVEQLDGHLVELKVLARECLGTLYSEGDYPGSLRGLFDVEWEFPAVEPPEYLRQLSPELFRQEQARVAARFEEAVRLAEEAFIVEFNKLVSHLTERLSGTDDGKPKVFRDSAVENLTDFFQRFGQLNVRSNQQLDELVQQAQQIVRGVEAQQLRENHPLRQEVTTQLSAVQAVLDGLLVDRPRRRILRTPR